MMPILPLQPGLISTQVDPLAAASSAIGPGMETSFDPALEDENSDEVRSRRQEVRRWLDRIHRSKMKFKTSFDLMKKNQEFATGLQVENQTDLDVDKYIANITLRMVNQKVATLYAKNPKAIAVPREKLDYQIWDGDHMTMELAQMQASQIVASGATLPPDLEALLADYSAGKQRESLVKKVCKTLELVYQYFVDAQRPEFKAQAKQMVRRAITAGVAYIKPILIIDSPEETQEISSIDEKNSVNARLARAQEIMRQIQEGELQMDSPQLATLRSLLMSIGYSEQTGDSRKLPVRLEFDFPPATSIIPDENCRNLEEWVGCRWLFQEYILPRSEINALFGVEVTSGTGEGLAKEVQPEKQPFYFKADDLTGVNDPSLSHLIPIYEIFDYQTKTRSFVCDGWKDYLLLPEPDTPCVSGFWKIFALVFNQVDVENNSNASVFPPSDVQLMKSPQKEWNRTRDALRDQRNANAPTYLVRKGALTDNDKHALRTREPNQIIELEGAPPDQPIQNFIGVLQVAAIDEKVYDTAPLEQDMMLAGGMQQANVGPAQPNVTATVGSIAEQSRMTVTQSNIDDLDGVFSRCASCGGEMLLLTLPEMLAKKIAGAGAAWPEMAKDDFVDEIYLTIQAASAGRPNKAVEIANFQQLAPLLLQSGANPVGVIEEVAKRLDDTMDISKFFPLQPAKLPAGGQGAGPSESASAGGPPSSSSNAPSGPQNIPGPNNPENNAPQ